MTEYPQHRAGIVRRGDVGMTLTEVLIVVVLIGVLTSAVAMAFSVIVRTTPPTEARADDARSLLGISTWLPPDVSSTPMSPLGTTQHWDVSPDRESGCAGSDRGLNLLRLSWSEMLGGANTTYVANYRIIDGAENTRIERVTCVLHGNRSTLNVTAGLPPSSAAPVSIDWKTAHIDGVEHIVGVEFEVTTFEGDTLRVDASSRNPAASLSDLPTPVTTTSVPPPPSTSEPDDGNGDDGNGNGDDGDGNGGNDDGDDETPPIEEPPDLTTPEPIPCAAGLVSVSPNPVENTGTGQGGGNNAVASLSEPVEVLIWKSGDCENLVLRYTRATGQHGSADDKAEQVRTFGDSVVLTLLAVSTERWERGNRTLELFLTDPDGGGTSFGTMALVVD